MNQLYQNSVANSTNGNGLQAAANNFIAAGVSVIPIKPNKQPTLSAWACYQEQKPTVEQIARWFAGEKPFGLAVVAGNVSGNLEALDIDCKYDLTGSLMKDFCDLVKEHLPDVFKKLVIAETVNKGYHILFRCGEIQGNKKLASRPATDEERAKGDKVKVLLETRGEGGYFAIAPTPGYKFIQGDLSSIPHITKAERETILTIARSFDQMPAKDAPQQSEQIRKHSENNSGLSPFDGYNERGDVPALLERHGWRRMFTRNGKIFYKRPGATDSVQSANYHTEKKIFYVFTTSSEFDSERGYNAVQVYTQLEHNGDYSAASKALYEDGFGARRSDRQQAQTGAPAVVSQSFYDAMPEPLPDSSIITPKLDEQLLPEAWREWLADSADRLQCPLDFPAAAALVSAAALIGNRINIKPKELDSWLVTPNLWGAVVGAPGVMKSPAVNEGLIFFREIASQERAVYERSLKDADFEKEFAEAQKAELSKEMRKASAGDKDRLKAEFQSLSVEAPKEKRLWTSDATVEKLGELLNENDGGMFNIRDELTGWFRQLDRSGHEQDRAFFLECWNGDGTFTFDRIARGNILIKNLTLSIFGTIQPAMIEPYLRGSIEGGSDDGLIQRFQILVHPDAPKTYQYIDRAPKGRDKARESFYRLHKITPPQAKAKQLIAEASGRWFLNFDAEAQGFFKEWLTELENNLRSGTFETSALESHLAKYRSLMPSLALIFHLLDSPETGSVEIKAAHLSAAWCSYLQKHAEKLYGSAMMSDFDIAKEILARIKAKQIADDFTARDIYGNHWKRLSKPEDVKRGLDVLADYGYLFAVTIDTGGRAKVVYRLHDSLKG